MDYKSLFIGVQIANLHQHVLHSYYRGADFIPIVIGTAAAQDFKSAPAEIM